MAAGQSLREYTDRYIAYFLEDFTALGAEQPEQILRATDYIDEMVALIKQLDAAGHTYRSDGSTYYRIATFPGYGKLSKVKFDGNIAGASERPNPIDRKARASCLENSCFKSASPTRGDTRSGGGCL